MLPSAIGRYRPLRVLGGGAMGVVYEAHDTVIDRRVAIKLVRAELLEGEARADYLERFRREAQAAGRCSHPSVVVVHDYAVHEGNPFLVMEYVDGLGLDKVLAQGERFAPEAAAHLTLQVLDALACAHGLGIVHRDVKPANILLIAGARVKVTDFGIARLESSSLTHLGMAVGTPSYMSPEQCRGDPVDHRSDLFSVACVLQEMLTGERPFPGRHYTAIAVRLVQDPPQGLERVEALGGAGLRAVLERALAKRPEERFESAAEMAEALRGAIGEPPPGPVLAETLDRTLVAVRARVPARMPQAPADTPAGADGGSRIDPGLLGSIERQLALRVGPIARYLVQTGVRTAATPEALCDALAERIDRPEERRRFLDEALATLRSGATGAVGATPGTTGRPPRRRDGARADEAPGRTPGQAPGEAASGPMERASAPLAAEEIERARRALTEILGPIAQVLVRRTLPEASGTADLWERLAARIERPADRAAFLARRGPR